MEDSWKVTIRDVAKLSTKAPARFRRSPEDDKMLLQGTQLQTSNSTTTIYSITIMTGFGLHFHGAIESILEGL